MKKDRSKIIDLFATEFDLVPTSHKPVKSKRHVPKSKGEATNKAKELMLQHLEAETFDEMDYKMWFQYFVLKAEEQGVKYLVRNYAKDYSIIKSILSELAWTELKLMIDFLWESNQDIQPKQTLGVWILSKGWINTIYQNSLLWRDGKYKPKSAPTHNREWIAEASKKPTSLKYGKPIKDSGKSENKESIRIGWDD